MSNRRNTFRVTSTSKVPIPNHQSLKQRKIINSSTFNNVPSRKVDAFRSIDDQHIKNKRNFICYNLFDKIRNNNKYKKKYENSSTLDCVNSGKHNHFPCSLNFIDLNSNASSESGFRIHSSITDSEQLFEWLIYPLTKEKFFKNHWEQIPIHIKRNKPKFYQNLLSTPMLDKLLRENNIVFSKNLDITCFVNDTRETHNPLGRALPSVVWDYYRNGCSVRLLNPQTYVEKLHILNATLQEFFNCFVGANSYLTPPNSQGFAPHYDDIEAFVLQIEGKKRWRLYKPIDENAYLPRKASPNFMNTQIGKPILETVVTAGDLLYFPRGTIHQGDTLGFDQHSLHLTISVYQKNTWGDFLEKLLPITLKKAIEDNVLFRKGLPLGYSKYIGSVCSNNSKALVKDFHCKVKFLLSIIFSKYLEIDRAADEMFKMHIHDFLPPVFNENENLCLVYAGGERMIDGAKIINQVDFELDTFIRLSRFHCSRLIEDNDTYHLYYSCDNSKEYHEYELQYLEVDPEFVPAIQKLFFKFPQYIRVKNLPIQEINKKIQIVRDLWEKGIIISKKPLYNPDGILISED